MSGIFIRDQGKGWMDNSLILDWISRVWENQCGAILAANSMLVVGSFHGYKTDEVKRSLQLSNLCGFPTTPSWTVYCEIYHTWTVYTYIMVHTIYGQFTIH